MKLVIDNSVEVSNLAELPVYDISDIAASARKFAEHLEAGKLGEPRRAIVILDTPNGAVVEYWGETANGLEIMGLLEVAKFRVYAVNECDDDD